MPDLFITLLPYLLLIVGILIVIDKIKRLFTPYKDTPFGFKGKLVYIDKGKRSATFFNKKYRIAAKGGDFIYLTENKTYKLIEYKSRQGKVHESDIAQTIASVLAARSKYPITEAVVFTGSSSKEINVSGSNEDLYNKIKEAYLLTQQIKNGEPVNVCYDNPYKCRSCHERAACERYAPN